MAEVVELTPIEAVSLDGDVLETQAEVNVPPAIENEHGRQISSLPPVDGGKDAWLFLAACFAIEALVWGV